MWDLRTFLKSFCACSFKSSLRGHLRPMLKSNFCTAVHMNVEGEVARRVTLAVFPQDPAGSAVAGTMETTQAHADPLPPMFRLHLLYGDYSHDTPQCLPFLLLPGLRPVCGIWFSVGLNLCPWPGKSMESNPTGCQRCPSMSSLQTNMA